MPAANILDQLIEWKVLTGRTMYVRHVSFRRRSHRCFVQPEGRRILHSSWAQGEIFQDDFCCLCGMETILDVERWLCI